MLFFGYNMKVYLFFIVSYKITNLIFFIRNIRILSFIYRLIIELYLFLLINLYSLLKFLFYFIITKVIIIYFYFEKNNLFDLIDYFLIYEKDQINFYLISKTL